MACERALEKEPYYHGLLPREDVKMILVKNGDFVLRISEPTKGEARQYILSVMHNVMLAESQAIKHFVIKNEANKWMIEKYGFDSIPQMIEHYLTRKEVIREAVLILRPIYRQKWELDHEQISISKKLGEGAFGEVSKGTLKLKNKTVNVAIKQAKLEKVTKEQILEFMREARTMRSLYPGHPHVVKFYGVAVVNEPLFLVMELATNGALNEYLQNNTDLKMKSRNEIVLQASWGLEYLHGKCLIHRDVAARNFLFSYGKVKISDFGMTRMGPLYSMNASTRVPFRWLAVETIKYHTFSLKSDVWSFGIFAWEVYNGNEPYPDMSAKEVKKLVCGGFKMTLPPKVDVEIAKIITSKCWASNPNDRSSMAEISSFLEIITGIKRPNFGTNDNKEEITTADLAHKKKRKTKKSNPPR